MSKRTAALVVLLAWWSWLGHEQSRVWQSDLSLWAYTARVQPYNMWAQKNYSTALIEAKQVEEACWQLTYIQRLATTDRVTEHDRTGLDAFVVDRLLALAYFDHQGRGSTSCRDDSILSVG